MDGGKVSEEKNEPCQENGGKISDETNETCQENGGKISEGKNDSCQENGVKISELERCELSFDGMLVCVGEFGRYQKLMILLSFLMNLACSMQIMIIYFAAFDPPWKCIGGTCEDHNKTFPSTDSKCYYII